jgi:hypothetical protein
MTALSGSGEGVTCRGLSSFFSAMFAWHLNAAGEQAAVRRGNNLGPYKIIDSSAGGVRVATSTVIGLDGQPACDALAARDRVVVGYLGK